MDGDRAEDATRAAVALLRAVLDGDEEGGQAIIDGTPPEHLCNVLAGMALAGLRMLAQESGHDDPDDAVRSQFLGFLTALPQA